jgi:formiminotetrahydrofolate cyclodeaminase
MRSYSSFSVHDLLDAFASTSPAPGGGSAAALTAGVGVSLLLMAIGVRASRPGGSPEGIELADAADRLRSQRATIASLVDRDAEAYSMVIAALRMPAEDEESKARRRTAIESAMRAATEAPLETMRACRRALRETSFVAAHAIPNTRSDVGVAVELLAAAVRAAGITVDANLASLKDMEYVALVRVERQQLDADSAADAEYARSRLEGRST